MIRGTPIGTCQEMAMKIKTRVFGLYNGRYRNLCELAEAMAISVSQVYRVYQGKRNINQKFIVGAMKAFPEYKLGDLFYLGPESTSGSAARTKATTR